MSIGDCIAKLNVPAELEKDILARVDHYVNERRMSESAASERALRDVFTDINKDAVVLAAEIKKAGGSQAHLDLAKHVIKYGEVEAPKAPTQVPLTTEAVTAKAKEPTEHVPAREPNTDDDIKNILTGGTTMEGSVNAYSSTKISPLTVKHLISRLNDMKVKGEQAKNVNEALHRLNDILGDKINGNDVARYALMVESLKKKSAEAVDLEKEITAKSRARVEKHIESVMGKQIDVEWADIMHAGEFEAAQKSDKGVKDSDRIMNAKDIIRLSVHSLDPMGTAYHESMHAFFKALRDQKNFAVLEPLYRAANSAPVINQLRHLLKDAPEALKQIEGDMEERVAYMYQFWAKEKLHLGPETKGVFTRLKEFFLKVLGIWTNDERAEHIMDYFHTGQFVEHIGDRNKVAEALLLPGRNKIVDSLKETVEPLKRLEAAMLGTGSDRLRDTLNPALTKIADLVAPKKTDSTSDVGFIQAWREQHANTLNRLAKELKGFTEEDLAAAHEALKKGESAKDPMAEKARVIVRKVLDDLFEYMRDAGVPVKDLGFQKDYFPRVWDTEYISKHQDQFTEMLDNYKRKGDISGDPKRILNRLIAMGGDESIPIDRPGMQHTKERTLRFIDPKDSAPFVEKNLFNVLNSYSMQAARRSEWNRRFNGETSLARLLADAKDVHGATDLEVATAKKFAHGVLGTLGDDLNPTYRRLFGNMMVYQNIRLLPLAIFSQAVDPLGIAVRGGTIGDSWNALVRGIKEIPRGFKKHNDKDEWYQLAETIGAIEDASLMHTIGTSYTQGMVSATARKINDALFRYNLVEQFTTSMRVAATEAAAKFLVRHGNGDYSAHSERFLAELGLKAGDVVIEDGRPLVTEQQFKDAGYSDEKAVEASAKMRSALNKWVDGAILRPNAAERPIWMNDPHYALFAHLKTFVYAFQHTILNRVWHEVENKNYAPAMALASYVPIMLASDLIKGMIQGGGEQPEWKKGWTWKQYMGSATERAGLYGVGQFGTDIMRDVKRGDISLSALGPTFEQGVDGLKALGGAQQYKTFAIHSLPANALYSDSIRRP